MAEDFKNYLSKAEGTIRRVNVHDVFVRRRDISTYYWNHASDLNAGALVAARASPHPVFALLAGLSLEVLLKAIAKILDRPFKENHRLNELREAVGISVTADQKVILDILTEHIYWRSRYPVPLKEAAWTKSGQIFDKALKKKKGTIFYTHNEKRATNLENYEKLWRKFETAYWQAKRAVHEP